MTEEAAPGAVFRIVHLEGGATQLKEIMGGNVDVAFDNVGSIVPRVQTGEVRALAVLDNVRSKFLPDVATTKELGYPTVVSNSTRGIAGPKGMPEPVLGKLREVLKKAMDDPDHVDKLEAPGLAIKIMVGDEYAATTPTPTPRRRSTPSGRRTARTSSRRARAAGTSVREPALAHPLEAGVDRLLQQFGLAVVVVRGALDDPEGLVAAARRVVDEPACGCGTASSAEFSIASSGTVTRQRTVAVRVGIVDRPLRQPRPQGREPPDPDRSGVGRLRLADEAARLAIVRLDRRVHEAGIAERAIGHEASLHLVRLPSSAVQAFPSPRPSCGGRARAGLREIARETPANKAAGCGWVVDVELEVAVVGIVLVRTDGSIQSESMRARDRWAAWKMTASAGMSFRP